MTLGLGLGIGLIWINVKTGMVGRMRRKREEKIGVRPRALKKGPAGGSGALFAKRQFLRDSEGWGIEPHH